MRAFHHDAVERVCNRRRHRYLHDTVGLAVYEDSGFHTDPSLPSKLVHTIFENKIVSGVWWRRLKIRFPCKRQQATGNRQPVCLSLDSVASISISILSRRVEKATRGGRRAGGCGGEGESQQQARAGGGAAGGSVCNPHPRAPTESYPPKDTLKDTASKSE